MRGRDRVREPCSATVVRGRYRARELCSATVVRGRYRAREPCSATVVRGRDRAREPCSVARCLRAERFYGVNGRARSSLLKMLCDEGDGVKGKWSVMEWSCGMELSDGV